jgi:hypothetical protein
MRTDVKLLRQTVQGHLQAHRFEELHDADAIDMAVTRVIGSLTAGIEASTPLSRPSPRSIPGFDQECKRICNEVQWLRRRWQQTRQDLDHEAYR